MRRWLPLFIALLALLAGLTVGALTGGDAVQARAGGQTSLTDQALNYQPQSGFTATGAWLDAPIALPRPAEAKRQLYLISDATGAICDVTPDPP